MCVHVRVCEGEIHYKELALMTMECEKSPKVCLLQAQTQEGSGAVPVQV